MWVLQAGANAEMLFVHGAVSDYRFFQAQFDHFRHRRGVAVASLGGYFPNAFVADSFSATAHAEEVSQHLRTLQSPAHLIGHSRGARIALHVAAMIPRNIKSLVLVEPGGAMEAGFLQHERPAPRSGAAPLSEALEMLERDPVASVRRYIEAGFGDDAWRRIGPVVRQCAEANAITLRGMVKDETLPLTRAAARRVAAPTLLVGGRRSPEKFADILDVLEAEIPRSKRITLSDADHFLPLSSAVEFNAALETFFHTVE